MLERERWGGVGGGGGEGGYAVGCNLQSHRQTPLNPRPCTSNRGRYLVAGGEVDGEELPEEEARHVVQDQAVEGQVEGRDPRLLLLGRVRGLIRLRV